jgi:hypothetical protein
MFLQKFLYCFEKVVKQAKDIRNRSRFQIYFLLMFITTECHVLAGQAMISAMLQTELPRHSIDQKLPDPPTTLLDPAGTIESVTGVAGSIYRAIQ